MPTNTGGKEPLFHVLDVVDVQSEWTAPGRGIVCQVRSYPDGTFRYSVGSLIVDSDVGGIYDEQDLRSTGERSPAEPFTTFGSFRIRDVVRISETSLIPEVAGKLGVIEGCTADDERELFVWVEELEELVVLPANDLVATGQRRTPLGPRPAMSSKVSPSGDVLGEESYLVLEDVKDL